MGRAGAVVLLRHAVSVRHVSLALVALALAGCSRGTNDSEATPSVASPSTLASTAPSLPVPTASSTTSTLDATSISESQGRPCGSQAPPPDGYDHVVWIWMENKNRDTVFESSEQSPFMHDLAAACASASNYVDRGIHPSLANYIAATSGDTQGITDDDPPSKHPLDVDNIFRQVRDSGRSAKSYEEAMPGNCVLDSAGRYAVKHNPAAYFVGADDREACQRDDVPFEQFVTDLAGPEASFPAFALVTPDLCHDMHDCPVETGDAWLRTIIEPIFASPLYAAGRTAVFVVFDESQGGGRIPFLAAAPTVRAGTVASATLDHFSLLRFTEDALGLDEHLGRAATATDLRDAIAGL